MKTLFLILALTVSAMAQQADTFFCIQIMSTKTPQYIRAEHLAMCTFDSAKVEQQGEYYRILFVYETEEEADFMIATWQRAHKDAFICTRTKQEINELKSFVPKS
jgi:hypothetical protein